MRERTGAAGTADNIRTLKGLACVLVVAYHVVGKGPGTGLNLPPDSLLLQFSDALLLLRMPLFTFLSGYLYSLRPVQWGTFPRFLRKKLVRLYVPAVSVGLLFLGATWLTPGVNGDGRIYGPLDVLFFSYAHFWFIQALIFIMLVTGMAEVCGLLSTPRRFAAVLLAAAAVSLLGEPLSEIRFFSIGRATYLLPFFLLGLGAQRYAGRTRWNETFMLALVFLFGATLALHVAGVTGIYGAPLEIRTVTALLLSCSGLLVLMRFVPPSRTLSFIGGYAFTIYLFHVFFTAGTRIVLARLGVDMVPLLFAAGLAAGLTGPMIVERLLMRMPRAFPLTLLGSAPKPRPALVDGAR